MCLTLTIPVAVEPLIVDLQNQSYFRLQEDQVVDYFEENTDYRIDYHGGHYKYWQLEQRTITIPYITTTEYEHLYFGDEDDIPLFTMPVYYEPVYLHEQEGKTYMIFQYNSQEWNRYKERFD